MLVQAVEWAIENESGEAVEMKKCWNFVQKKPSIFRSVCCFALVFIMLLPMTAAMALSSNSVRYTFTTFSSGNTYCYDSDSGERVFGWLQVENGDWYYFDSDTGAMQTGWHYISGAYYYLYREDDGCGMPEGVCAISTVIDGHEILPSGAEVDGPKRRMNEISPSLSSSTSYLILVDTVACKVGVFTGYKGHWSIVKYWDCSPGKSSTPTIKGSFVVQGRGFYFDPEDGGRCYYYTQFYGNYLFHSVIYDRSGYTGSSHILDGRLGLNLSHGCVRLDIDNAYWIYKYIPSGTKVYIY